MTYTILDFFKEHSTNLYNNQHNRDLIYAALDGREVNHYNCVEALRAVANLLEEKPPEPRMQPDDPRFTVGNDEGIFAPEKIVEVFSAIFQEAAFQHIAPTKENALAVLDWLSENSGVPVASNIRNALTLLDTAGKLTRRTAPPVEQVPPATEITFQETPQTPRRKLKDGTDALPDNPTEFEMKQASSEQLKEYLRRGKKIGQIERGDRNATSSRFI